eukprot:4931324-Amphidinium_carterae.1
MSQNYKAQRDERIGVMSSILRQRKLTVRTANRAVNEQNSPIIFPDNAGGLSDTGYGFGVKALRPDTGNAGT